MSDETHPAGLPVAGVSRGGDLVQIPLPLQQRRLLACQALLSGAQVAPGLQGTSSKYGALKLQHAVWRPSSWH